MYEMSFYGCIDVSAVSIGYTGLVCTWLPEKLHHYKAITS